MPKYTVVYTAHHKDGSPIFDAFSKVDYIEGDTYDDAIDKHVQSLYVRKIHDIVGTPIIFEGHIEEVEDVS